MTLSASRKTSGSTDLVTVRACYGPITFEIDEQRGHALHFWHDLGKIVIDNGEDRAKAGYERFHDALGGERQPWGDLAPAHRDAWIAAFTE